MENKTKGILKTVVTALAGVILSTGVVFAGTMVYENIWKTPEKIELSSGDFEEITKITEESKKENMSEEKAKEIAINKLNEIQFNSNIVGTNHYKEYDSNKIWYRFDTEDNYEISIDGQTGEFFDIWDAYNDLDRMFAFKQATENGILKYKSYTCRLKESFEYCFELTDGSVDCFPDGQQIDCTDDDSILNLEKLTASEQLKKLHSDTVGVFDRIEGNKCYIVDNNSDSRKKLPNQGYLFVSIAGDAVRLSRRERAKSEIVTDSAPIKGLARMIDKGVAVDRAVKDENPVTEFLKRKFPDKIFNQEQREAIKTALDTPDIALILGPPGTGKTTVIKAIIARYEEYYKKHNDRQIWLQILMIHRKLFGIIFMHGRLKARIPRKASNY